ncbi:MAG: sulfur oxidation c-type cytochrome SoxX [Rhodoferax sp.]|uniref:sulfur oxidation c-type cytochrome SoxX n=1 Tax=Polynucleobacter hallstattensis TaxID=1855586 RepID=UPI001C0BAF93|nr:sulfur oxidation c-type cytochrome SoxX [Polynucleobacter hallstattensis]MBU3561507.1 sulfur oxidation c-type cytochrome SoxX [Polynucleobacter hallstattensis]MCF8166952.1 sulfur oxidation c-type cytochrome SoxX [Rhodoferax sp.]MCF8189705.1 sulfur oxidation c-type cytochrome SoxX [Polynucleobacter sp.]
MKITHLKQLLAATGFIFATGLVQTPALAQQKNDPKFNKMIQDSFRAEGIAGLDRIDQDATQKFCSDPKFADSKQGQAMREKIQKINMDTIKQPSDGKYIGDWKSGERIAQSGRGATWSDKADTQVGGGCYNCHQIDPKEISYGNIGPSLTGYGKMRGYSPEVVTYTWNRINNSKAYNACSNMPRFAHFKLLNEKQIQDVMALLLDPESPVNK